jgi:hypothetical protein
MSSAIDVCTFSEVVTGLCRGGGGDSGLAASSSSLNEARRSWAVSSRRGVACPTHNTTQSIRDSSRLQGCWEAFCGTGRGSSTAGFRKRYKGAFNLSLPACAVAAHFGSKTSLIYDPGRARVSFEVGRGCLRPPCAKFSPPQARFTAGQRSCTAVPGRQHTRFPPALEVVGFHRVLTIQ